MSADAAIKVENLGKRYIISHQRAGGDGLRHVLQRKLTAPWHALRQLLGGQKSKPGRQESQSASEEFWALRDVSFEIKRGEVVGIIGRNGAGKSTLLKILSRITEPTTGRITIEGRVASLLEVGTGFHADLSGRENIFLNGAILGMTQVEIRKKFDEIVAFAEIEKFLDTPVKRYSSGMYVKLAFAVAAHLEPEILIVDEVLAVGDIQFQKKCLGKMGEVASQQGRTVLFVSHNMGAITRLCGQGIFLAGGQMLVKGDVNSVVSRYLSAMNDAGSRTRSADDVHEMRQRKKVFFTAARILDHEKHESGDLDVRRPFHVAFEYEVPRELQNIEMSVRILTSDGRAVLTTLLSDLSPEALSERKQGAYEACIEFPGMFLMPGEYLVNIAAHEPMGEIFDLQESATRFAVQDTGTNFAKYQHYEAIGVVIRNLPWQQRRLAPV